MPLTSAVRSIDTAGTGAQTAFAFPFRFDSATHVRVSKLLLASPYTETVLSEGTGATNYAITAPAANGGTVTLVTALPATYELRIQRVVPLTQLTDFAAQGSFAAATHASAFDYAMMVAQQINDAAIVADEVISGQINTASNVNIAPNPDTGGIGAGIGVYKQKTGNDLEFRGIVAADGKITTTLDAATNAIRIGVGTGIPRASVTDAASAAALTAEIAVGVATDAAVAALDTRIDATEILPVNIFVEDFEKDTLDTTRWTSTAQSSGAGTVEMLPTSEFGRVNLKATGVGAWGNKLTTKGALCNSNRVPVRARFSVRLIQIAVGFTAEFGLTNGTTGTKFAKFRYDGDADKWWADVKDGTTLTSTDLATAGVTTDVALDIRMDGVDIKFYINGTLKATKALALGPPTGTSMHALASISVNNAAERAVYCDYAFVQWTSPSTRIA